MKLITAIVRPEKLEELIGVVIDNGGRGLTATEVRGFGRQFGHLTAGTELAGLPVSRKAALLPKIRMDILVLDDDAEASAMRVRTGERGRDAM